MKKLSSRIESERMTWHTRVVVGVALLFVLSTASKPAYAYLDPGTLTMLFSAIAAGFAVCLVYIKIGWSKAIGLFWGASRRKKAE